MVRKYFLVHVEHILMLEVFAIGTKKNGSNGSMLRLDKNQPWGSVRLLMTMASSPNHSGEFRSGVHHVIQYDIMIYLYIQDCCMIQWYINHDRSPNPQIVVTPQPLLKNLEVRLLAPACRSPGITWRHPCGLLLLHALGWGSAHVPGDAPLDPRYPRYPRPRLAKWAFQSHLNWSGRDPS